MVGGTAARAVIARAEGKVIVDLRHLDLLRLPGNVVPKKIAKLCTLAEEGEMADAAALHRELSTLNESAFRDTSPIGVKYMAWKLLRGDMSHVFFKDMKQNGRILSFKAKARKAVDNAKTAFCANHEDDVEFCFV